MTPFADYDLARRIELIAAADSREFAQATDSLFPALGASWVEVAGGIAGYAGSGSPLNGAVGLGFAGDVTHEHIGQIERFFIDRAEPPVISVCPLAHPSLATVLGEKQWTVGAFENVLMRNIAQDESRPDSRPDVEVRECVTPEERELWAIMVANGFSAPDDPTPAELRLGAAATLRRHTHWLLGVVDGEPAGTAELRISGDVAWLSADTTLPHFRRRGVQSSLQRARLALARDSGCTLAISESMPGSPSQRNMERLGFRVVYTRVDATGPVPALSSVSKGSAS